MVFNRKNGLILLLMGICITLACKKDKHIIKEVSETTPPPVQVAEKSDLPIQFISGKSKMVFSYTANLSLSKIDYANGDSVVLNYTSAGKPNDFFRYKGGKLVLYSEFTLDENGLVVRSDQYTMPDDGFFLNGYYILKYNTAGQLITVSYYTVDNHLVNEQQKIYTAAGNLSNDNSTLPDLMLNYQYDDKNGLFKNANYAWLFALEKENILFLSVFNNLQQCNYPLMQDSSQSFSYVYNADQYPVTINSIQKGISSSITVTYKQLN